MCIRDRLKGDIKARNVVVVFKDEDDIDLIHSVINKRCASRPIHITGGEFRRDLDAGLYTRSNTYTVYNNIHR